MVVNYHVAEHSEHRNPVLFVTPVAFAITANRAYTRPWKVVWPLLRQQDPKFQHLEEACWEGERDVPRFLELGYRFYFGEPWRSR